MCLSRNTDTGNVDPFCYPAFSWIHYSSEGVLSLTSLRRALLCKFQSLPAHSMRCYHLHCSGMSFVSHRNYLEKIRGFAGGVVNLFLIHWRLNTDLFGTQPWNWMKVTAVILKASYSLSSHGKLLQSKWLFHYLLRLQQKSCHERALAWRKHSFSPIATKQKLWNKLCSFRNKFSCSHNLKTLWLALLWHECFSAFCLSVEDDNLSNHTMEKDFFLKDDYSEV